MAAPKASEVKGLTRALAAVLDLHKPTVRSDGREICTGCSDPKWNVYVFAPCETVRVIAEKLGVDDG
jgi:hypothetical protein